MKKILFSITLLVAAVTLSTAYAASSTNSCNVNSANDTSGGKVSLTKWSWYCWNKEAGMDSKPTGKATYIGFQCPEANTTQCGPNTPGSVEIDLNGSQPGNFIENVSLPYKGDGQDVYTNNLLLGECGRVQTDWIETPEGVIAGGVVRKSDKDCSVCREYKTVEVGPKDAKAYIASNKPVQRKTVKLSNVATNVPVKVTSWWGWTGGKDQREGEKNEQKNESNLTSIAVFDSATDAVKVATLGCIDMGNLPGIREGFGNAVSPFEGGQYFQCGNNNDQGLSKTFNVRSSDVTLKFETKFTGLEGVNYEGKLPPINLRGSHYNKLVVTYCAK